MTELKSEVDQAAQKVVEMTALEAQTRKELAALASTPVGDLLTDPSRAQALAHDRSRLAELLTIHGEMLAAALQQREDAVSEHLAIEADQLQADIDKAEADLAAWLNREEKLRGALEEFVGRGYRQMDPFENRSPGATVTAKATTDGPLRQRVRELGQQREALNAAARGEEPTAYCPVELLPPPLAADGIRPAAAALARKQREDEERAYELQMAADQEKLTVACEALGIPPLELSHVTSYRMAPEAVEAHMRDVGHALAVAPRGEGTGRPELNTEQLRVVLTLADESDAQSVLRAVLKAL